MCVRGPLKSQKAWELGCDTAPIYLNSTLWQPAQKSPFHLLIKKKKKNGMSAAALSVFLIKIIRLSLSPKTLLFHKTVMKFLWGFVGFIFLFFLLLSAVIEE